MIFDLKGRRRRVVQATYLMLAVLMGGGLVFFGIGSGVSGGLLDAFKGNKNGSTGNATLDKRAQAAERKVAANPRDAAALVTLARTRFQLAGLAANAQTSAFTPASKIQLRKAASAWERYLALGPAKPDADLARAMLQTYAQAGLNKPAKAAEAAEIVAGDDPSAASYVNLARYAQLAGQTRKSELAGQKAIDVATKDERAQVKAAVKQIKQGSKPGAGAGAGAGAAAPPGG